MNETKKKTAPVWDCNAGAQITEEVGTGMEEKEMLNVCQEHANFQWQLRGPQNCHTPTDTL